MSARCFKYLLCVLTMCCCFSFASAEGINLSASVESPLAVIAASSSENATKAAFLLYQANGPRDGATMETCVFETLSDSIDGEVETKELYVLRITFGEDTDEPELSSGAYFLKIQLLQNSDGTYSLLSFLIPEEGENMYTEVENYFSAEAAEMLVSQQDDLMTAAQAEALTVWNQYCNKSTDANGSSTIMSSISPDDIRNSNDPSLQVGMLISSIDENLIREYTVDGNSLVWIEY